jgi:hypothetical protein
VTLRTVIDALRHPVIFALVIPVLFTICSPLAKRLTRSDNRWRRDDFYLGTELALATISTTIFYAVDLLNAVVGKTPLGITVTPAPAGFMATFVDQTEAAREINEKLLLAMLFLVLCFMSLLWLISENRNLVEHSTEPLRRIWWRIALFDGMGYLVMIGFAALVKGVS